MPPGAEHRLASNERLEFLGDAILGFVVCELLFRQFPQYLEGELTKIKSIVVSRQTCAKISEALGLQEFLILGKGMTTTPTVPPSVLADVFESLIAAIYLDGGHEAARQFINTYLGPRWSWRRPGNWVATISRCCSSSPNGNLAARRRITCSTKKGRITASVSRSLRRSRGSVIRRLGAAIRRKRSSDRRAMRCRS